MEPDLLDGHRQELFAVVPVVSQGSLVDLHEVQRLVVVDPHGVGMMRKEHAEVLLGLAQRQLGSLAMGDVVGESVKADSLGIPGPPNGEVDGEAMPIAVLCFDLKVPAKQRRFVGRSELGQATAVGVAVAHLFGDDQLFAGPSDRLGALPAEYLLGLGVPVNDHAAVVEFQVGVIRRLEGRAQPLLGAPDESLRLGEMLGADTQESDHEQTGEGRQSR